MKQRGSLLPKSRRRCQQESVARQPPLSLLPAATPPLLIPFPLLLPHSSPPSLLLGKDLSFFFPFCFYILICGLVLFFVGWTGLCLNFHLRWKNNDHGEIISCDFFGYYY